MMTQYYNKFQELKDQILNISESRMNSIKKSLLCFDRLLTESLGFEYGISQDTICEKLNDLDSEIANYKEYLCDLDLSERVKQLDHLHKVLHIRNILSISVLHHFGISK